MCGLGSDICGIHIISPAARFRTAASSGTLVNGLAKIRKGREWCHGDLHEPGPISAVRRDGDMHEDGESNTRKLEH